MTHLVAKFLSSTLVGMACQLAAVESAVQVSVEQRDHLILTQAMREDTPHAFTSEEVRQQLKALKTQIKPIEAAIRQQLKAQHQAMYDAERAAKAREAWAERSRLKYQIRQLESSICSELRMAGADQLKSIPAPV